MSAPRHSVCGMKIILVPGLWLDGSSWGEVAPLLEGAGHHVLPLTLPGVGEPAEQSSEVGIADWVAAVVEQIDAAGESVVLVGHSGGGNVVWGAADARPDLISRVVFVDTVPPPPDSGISEFSVVDGVIPFPGWDFFPDEDVYDIDAEMRERTTALTRSVPAKVPTDPLQLSGGRERVPVTMLMGALDQQELESMLTQWGSYGEEYRAIDAVTVEKIGSGHWPQFTQPVRLSAMIDAAAKA